MTARFTTATMSVWRRRHACWTNYPQWWMGKPQRGEGAYIPPGMTPKLPNGAFTAAVCWRKWASLSQPWPVQQKHRWEHSQLNLILVWQQHGSTKPQQDNENCWRNNLCLTATFAGHLPRTACTKPAASSRTPNILRMAGLHSGKIQKYKRLFRTVILSVCKKQTQVFIFVNI